MACKHKPFIIYGDIELINGVPQPLAVAEVVHPEQGAWEP